ncbi:MAG: hypothetical protein KF767_02490 [Bdellovibrionaceae bacterium]|nr:hypothetical protein [Pseudobdellovibrionaceae bacterium]
MKKLPSVLWAAPFLIFLLLGASPASAQLPEIGDEIPMFEGEGEPAQPPQAPTPPAAVATPSEPEPEAAPEADAPAPAPATNAAETPPPTEAPLTEEAPPRPAAPKPKPRTKPKAASEEANGVSHDTGIAVVNQDKKKRRKISAGFTMGHLMTPAVSTLEKGETTFGTMVVGVGLSDRYTVAVSPWLLGFYNMNNLSLRFQADPQKAESWGFQASYFKDNPEIGKLYKMEAGSLWLNYRSRVSRFHRIHWSLNYMHFMNMDVPFSLKRWSFNDSEPQGQLSFTTLQEIATTPHTRVALEFGAIGLNYRYPNYHFGASTAYRFEGGYIQFGLSATGYFTNITRSAYNQVYNEYMKKDPKLDFTAVYKNSVAVHPEIQLQLFF